MKMYLSELEGKKEEPIQNNVVDYIVDCRESQAEKQSKRASPARQEKSLFQAVPVALAICDD